MISFSRYFSRSFPLSHFFNHIDYRLGLLISIDLTFPKFSVPMVGLGGYEYMLIFFFFFC